MSSPSRNDVAPRPSDDLGDQRRIRVGTAFVRIKSGYSFVNSAIAHRRIVRSAHDESRIGIGEIQAMRALRDEQHGMFPDRRHGSPAPHIGNHADPRLQPDKALCPK